LVQAFLVAQSGSAFNIEIKLRNIILRLASIFPFLHSQGHLQTFAGPKQKSALPAKADIAVAILLVRSVWTAPAWQEESSLCSIGRSSHVFGLLRGTHDRWP
jgi:hypothetical protein